MTVDAASIATIVASLGGGAILLELTKRIADTLSSRGSKRRDEVDRAHRRADREAAKRRLIEEHASHLRRILYAAECVDTATIPAWPSYASTDTAPTQKDRT